MTTECSLLEIQCVMFNGLHIPSLWSRYSEMYKKYESGQTANGLFKIRMLLLGKL